MHNEPLRVLDLFSGIGGFSLGLERAGMRTVAFCEIEPFCRRVLAKHWPGVPCFDDIRTLTADKLPEAIDVICGGFPCQDISYAGKGAGIEGERSGLWKEYARLIGEIRPQFAVMENVSALLERGLFRVLGDLASLGYDAEWHCIPASAVGAPHERDRIWIVAYPNGQGGEGLVTREYPSKIRSWGWRGKTDLQSIIGSPYQQGDRWPKPLLRRMDDGLSNRTHRLKAIGNAVVPAIPELIGRAIIAATH